MRAAALIALALVAGPTTGWGQTHSARAAALRLTGYADFGYAASEAPGTGGFRGGVLFTEASYVLAERWSLFGEVGARARAEGMGVSVERVELSYAPNDALELTLGRFHTPITYWNRAYPRGGWGRATTDVPAVADPYTGLLAQHAVGVRADGRIDGPALGLEYTIGFSNGRDANVALPGDAGDADGHGAWMLGLQMSPAAFGGLHIGGGIYRDRPALAPEATVAERIVTGYVALDRSAVEILGEYAQVRHRDETTGEKYRGRAAYIQVAGRLAGHLGAWKPYLRWERVDTDGADPLYPPETLDLHASMFGVRYDFADFGAVKAEYRSERRAGAERIGSVRLHFAVRIGSGEPSVLVASVPPADARAGDQGEPGPAEVETTASPPAPDAKATPDRPAQPANGRAPARRDAEPARRLAGAVAIVVHPGVKATDLSLPELRRIFRGEHALWPDDQRIVLLVRSPTQAERDIVLGRIYQMGEAEFRQLWIGRIFREASVSGPKVVSDIETASQLVASLAGAITFMPADQVPPGLRVLRIDGKLPGEDGYPLQ